VWPKRYFVARIRDSGAGRHRHAPYNPDIVRRSSTNCAAVVFCVSFRYHERIGFAGRLSHQCAENSRLLGSRMPGVRDEYYSNRSRNCSTREFSACIQPCKLNDSDSDHECRSGECGGRRCCREWRIRRLVINGPIFAAYRTKLPGYDFCRGRQSRVHCFFNSSCAGQRVHGCSFQQQRKSHCTCERPSCFRTDHRTVYCQRGASNLGSISSHYRDRRSNVTDCHFEPVGPASAFLCVVSRRDRFRRIRQLHRVNGQGSHECYYGSPLK
jgi:hypothetical protein